MVSIDIVKTGRNIKRLRKEHGLSVLELAQRLSGQTPQAIYNWQSGRNLPTAENMIELSLIFNTPLEKLYCYELVS